MALKAPALLQALADMREYDALAGEVIEAALGIDPGAVADAIEAEVVRREVALGNQRIQRTHQLPAPVTTRIKRRRMECEAGCQCVLCHSVGMDPGERIHTTGRVATAKSVRADERQANRQAAAARRKANGGR